MMFTLQVCHSMAVNDSPLDPWVAFDAGGGVETGHCTCAAGWVL